MMGAADVQDAFHMLSDFLRADEHYLASSQAYGDLGLKGMVVYVTGEVGVGAGIVMDGRLRRGGQGYSGEIGHIELVPAELRDRGLDQ